MKIRFIESPTGVFGLGYFVGDVVEMDGKQAAILIEGGFAEAVTPVVAIEKSESDVEDKTLTAEKNKVLVKSQKGKGKK